jgi:hypothetical protein
MTIRFRLNDDRTTEIHLAPEISRLLPVSEKIPSLYFYSDGGITRDLPCRLRGWQPAHRETEREDEASFESSRGARHGVRRDGICRDGNARGSGKFGRLLPDRHHFGHARLRIRQPRTMPRDVFRPRRRLLSESISEQYRQQRHEHQQRPCLSAEASAFTEAGCRSVKSASSLRKRDARPCAGHRHLDRTASAKIG